MAVAILAAMAVAPMGRLLDQHAEMRGLQAETAELHAANDDLRAQIQRLRDPVELEHLARACLGMVARGEIAFVVPGDVPDC